MNFVVLDLEWSGAYSGRLHRFINEIVEFGAVKFDENFNVTDKFQMLVRPQISGRISNEVVNLMGITKEELFSSKNNFLYGVNAFGNFAKDSIILTWGTDDIVTLIDNYMYYTGKRDLPFLDKYVDLQDYCHRNINCEIETQKLGLLTCCQKLGVAGEETEIHRAYTDAYLSMICMKKLYNEDVFQSYIADVNDEFYRRLTHKNKRITDINHPLINENDLDFVCEDCGHIASRVTNYNIKNRSLFADYFCLNCYNEFKGKINLNLKFDEVVVKKSIVKDEFKE